MKYKVNMDLKRYDKAVYELKKGSPEQIERAIQLIKDHNLYHFGLKEFAGNAEICLKIKAALGEYLYSKKNYPLASLTLESCGCYEKALEAYRHCQNTKKIIEILKNNFTPENRVSKIKELTEYFTEKQTYGLIGDIVLAFAQDDNQIKEAAQYYVKGNSWAILTEKCFKNQEIIDKIILPGIKLEANIRTNLLRERITDLQTKVKRLETVQEDKRLRLASLGEGGLLLDSDASSEFSEMSSGSKKSGLSKASGSSTSSKSSQKSKAPKNLLKRKVKEGSLLEEEWLVGNLILSKFDDKLKSMNG
jgi:hypothetical protein